MIVALSTSSAVLFGLLVASVVFLVLAVLAARVEWTQRHRLRQEARMVEDQLRRVFALQFAELSFPKALERIESYIRRLSEGGTPDHLHQVALRAHAFMDSTELDRDAIRMSFGEIMLLPVEALAFTGPATDSDLVRLTRFQRATDRLLLLIAEHRLE